MSDSESPQISLHVEVISVDCEALLGGDIGADIHFHARITSQDGTWDIRKSLKETKSLNKKLKRDPKFRGIDNVPPPEPSKIFSNGTHPDETVRQIREELARFLHHICHRNILYTSHLVQRYLKTPKLVRRNSEQLRRSLAIPLRQGYMTCKLDESSPAKKYFCSLFPSYALEYYEDEGAGKPIGVVDLSKARNVFDFPKQDRFGVECGAVIMFTCENLEEKEAWFQCFRDLLSNPSTSPFITELPRILVGKRASIKASIEPDSECESDLSADEYKRETWLADGSQEIEENKEIDHPRRSVSTPGRTRSQLKQQLQQSHDRERNLCDEITDLKLTLEELQEKSEQVRRQSVTYQDEHAKLMERCAQFEHLMQQENERAELLENKLEEVQAEYRHKEELWNQHLMTAENEIQHLKDVLQQQDQQLHQLQSTHTVVQSGTLGKFRGTTVQQLRHDKLASKHFTFISSRNVLMWSVDWNTRDVKQCTVTDVSIYDAFIEQNIVPGNRANRWFKIESPTRILVLLAKDEKERDTWVNVIRQSLENKKHKRSRASSSPPRTTEEKIKFDKDSLEPPDQPARRLSS